MSLKSLEVHFDTTAGSDSSRRVFWGVSDNINDDPEDILADPLCPRKGDVDKFNPLRTITDVQAEHRPKTTKSLYWLITYTSEVAQAQEFTDPLNQPATITLDSETIETHTCFDKNGKAVMNSAGDLVYIPIDDTRWIFNVEKNVNRVPISLLQFNNAINDSMFVVNGLPCEKETLAVKNLRVGPMQTVPGLGGYPVEFMVLSFQLHYRKESWVMTYPNVGFNAIFDTPTYKVPNNFDGQPKYDYIEADGSVIPTDSEGNKVFNGKKIRLQRIKEKRAIKLGASNTVPTNPEALDKDGKWLPNAKPEQVIQLRAEVYQTRNFNELPLR